MRLKIWFTNNPSFFKAKLFAGIGLKILAGVGNSGGWWCTGQGCMYTWGARGMLTMSPSTSGSHKKEFELKLSDYSSWS
jgi:hypothetical protein